MNKKTIITIGAVILVGAAFAISTGTFIGLPLGEKTIVWSNIADGSALSASTNKVMLIDVYTDWCTWCKKMDKDTYHTPEISDYVNQKFVPIRLNAESQESRFFGGQNITDSVLALALGVQEYPTTIFVTPEGTPITSVPGYIPPADFKQMLRFIGEGAYKHMDFEQYQQSLN